MKHARSTGFLGAALLAVLPLAGHAQLVTGLQGAQGSTIGPDGHLYVTEGAVGRISRVNPQNGIVTTFANGLPPSLIGVGGAVDIAFLGNTAYVLVALNGSDVGGTTPVGVYRVDNPHTFTLIADLGAFSQANPPQTPFDLSQGVQFSMDAYLGDLLVTDGHHNRVLRVSPDGNVGVFRSFDNIVPTGLAIDGSTAYLARAGAAPHAPEEGKIIAFGPGWESVGEVAAGAPLLVDVEFGGGRRLYALAQGTWNGDFPGSPAFPLTGSLMKLDGRGELVEVVGELNLPTSLEIIRDDAYVVTLTGDIWKFEGVVDPAFPRR